MTTFTWDPAVYRRYDDQRSRPFSDLVGRVAATAPRRVVDAGCGDGRLTATLAARWPGADVVGFDTSEAMLAGAPQRPGLTFEVGDVRTWDPAGADVVVSNAVLQWVPDAPAVLGRWAAALPAGGWLAVQVPRNFDAPSHALMREVAGRFPAAGGLRGPDAGLTAEAATAALLDAGLVADVWETTYLHVLDGPDPVLQWVTGTGLRPVLAALDEQEREAFTTEYSARLREAYPRRADGRTVFPFRRLFVVGTRPADEPATRRVGITGLDHVQLAVPAGAEERLRAFYGGLLGMTEQGKPPALAGRGGCWFTAGSAVVHLGVEEPFTPARKAHPAFVVDDLDALQSRLEAAGHPCTRTDGEIPGVRRFHTHDVVGNRVEFQAA